MRCGLSSNKHFYYSFKRNDAIYFLDKVVFDLIILESVSDF